MSFEMTIGSRAQVWHGKAHHTAGGLVKSELLQDPKTGRIKSKAAVRAAKLRLKNNPRLREVLQSHQFKKDAASDASK